MKPLERLRRWRVFGGVALLLWLTLLGAVAVAAVAAPQVAGPSAASAMAPVTDTGPMPMASNCMPCALCCIAPAPAAHSFSGECKESDEPVWRVHAPPVQQTTWRLATGGWQARLPVRIVFCRWLD